MPSRIILDNSWLGGRRWVGASREYLNGGSRSILMPTKSRRSETFAYQQWDLLAWWAKAMDYWRTIGQIRVLILPCAESPKCLKRCKAVMRLKTTSSQKGHTPNSTRIMGWGTVCLHLMIYRRRRIYTLSAEAQSNSSKPGPQTLEP